MSKVTFELEGKEYELPEFINIDTYMKVYKLKDVFSDEYFSAKLINMVSGAPLEQLLQANYQQIEYLSNYIMLLFPIDKPPFIDRFELNGVHYGFLPSWREISFAEFVDLDTLMNKKADEVLDYIHIITAIMYRPIISEKGLHNFTIEKYNAETMVERANLFKKELDIKYFMGAQFFFIKYAKKYIEHTHQSSNLTMKDQLKFLWKNRKLMVKLLLSSNSDGLQSSTEYAKMILQSTMKSSRKSWWKSLTTLPTWLKRGSTKKG